MSQANVVGEWRVNRRQSIFDALGIIGESVAFRAVLESAGRYAVCDVPVLIYGETGVGKELVARAVHYLSARRERPFIPVNCGALPDSLLENELFGHSRGAYTDARASQKGLIALAEGGTLLLDEIDALSRKAQVALLRFLQDRQYRPLGSDITLNANIRVIAATNADLGALIADGDFRQDLMFRLDVAPVRVPPLRERGTDVLRLAEHFLAHFARNYGRAAPALTAKSRAQLLAHSWPGNVRELENAMHRAAILAADGTVDDVSMGLLSAGGLERDASAPPPPANDFAGGLKCARARCVARFEQHYLRWLLKQAGGNVSEAARAAGAERRHLGRMIKRAGLKPELFRASH